MRRSSHGPVYLVGAGPGDPKLITLRALEVLRRAQVVIYDHLVPEQLLESCAPGTTLIYAGKRQAAHAKPQREVNRLLIRYAKAGRCVVRLKGGDPFVFGRGGEEALALAKAKLAFEIVPGVTSAVAVPAYAGIPLSHRKLASSVAIVTGHEDPDKDSSSIRWDALSTACDTLVCLMGVNTLASSVERLVRHGRPSSTPCAVIEWGTTPSQRTVTGTLRTIVSKARRAGIRPPAVFVVGDVVSLRPRLNWYETKPLFGRRILVTRASDKEDVLGSRLRELGAAVDYVPALELVGVSSNGRLRDALQGLPGTDWVFFTSPEGVRWLKKTLALNGRMVQALAGCHIGVIGPKTAQEVEAAGLDVDFVPRHYRQEGILKDLPRRTLQGKRAVIFNAEGSRDVLAEGLRRRGMVVTTVPIYRSVAPRGLSRQISQVFRRPVDLVTVTSASCVDHLAQALRAAGKRSLVTTVRFASIGPVTSQAIRRWGGHVAVEAKTSTIEGLLEAMTRRHKDPRGFSAHNKPLRCC